MTDLAPIRHDASDLLAVVERARALLDDGDVFAARLLAGVVYEQAHTADILARRMKAGAELIAKARRLQGDALLIETRANIRIVEEWEKAKAEGATSRGGRPKRNEKAVPRENGFTAQEAGLTRKEIHEARKVAEAERREPGIAERAIAARIAAGVVPSRAALRHAIGTRTATRQERGDNLYETPAEAVATLLAVEKFGPLILEPACGRGAIARPLEAAGHEVLIGDLVDYGTSTKDGECQEVRDFLAAKAGRLRGRIDIVTNPPYGEVMNGFIAHALREFRPRKMALLLNLNAICGFEDADRNFWLDEWPPARIWVFSRRLPMMHRDGWEGPKASSQMNTAWLVWEKTASRTRPYGAGTTMKRVDWKEYWRGPAA